MLENNHLTAVEEKKRYDLHQNNPDDEGYRRFLSRLARPLSMKLRQGSKGLDFGCGSGPTLSFMLEEHGCSVVNYDPFYFPEKNLLEMKYDFIASTETIEHFRSPRKEFLLLDRMLKQQEGYLGLMTEILESDHQFNDWWYHGDPTHICFYQKATFDWIAAWRKWTVEYPDRNIVIFSRKEEVLNEAKI